MTIRKVTRNSPKPTLNPMSYSMVGISPTTKMKGWVLFYILLISLIEIANPWVGTAITALSSALLIFTLINHYLMAVPDNSRDILLVLAVAPFTRLVSTSIPLEELPLLYRFVVIGLPILLAEILLTRHFEISIERLGFSLTNLRLHAIQHLLIQVTVIVFSFFGYLQIRPSPLVESAGWMQILISILVLTIFVGLVEEVLFRGLLLSTAENLFGKAGIFVSAFLYMMMYWGTQSVGYVLMMAVVGVFFGWHAKRTQSLWGVTIAHSLMMVGILLYWPVF